jgi:hypothetical protein
VLDRGPLRLPTFRHLAAAFTINELGNWIGDVALAILVFNRTGSALATAGLFLALRFAPALLAPLVTSRLEVFDARRILPAVHFGEALIFAGIAVLAHYFSLPAVLALSALDGMLAIAAKALTRSATVSLLSGQDLLRPGNAILNMGFNVGGAIGPAVAGLLVAADGPGAALTLDAISFAVVAVILATAQDLSIESDHETSSLGRLRTGVHEVWRRPGLRRLLFGAAAAMMFGAAVVPIEVVFAKRTLHAGDAGYGLLIGSWGVGMIVGGSLFAAAGRVRLAIVVTAGMGLIAAGYTGLAAAPDLAIACVFSALGGAGNGIWWISVVTAVQQAIPTSAQSVAMAVVEVINQLMPALGFILGGAVTALSSPRTAYALAAAGVAAVIVATSVRPIGEVEVESPLTGAG